MDIDLFDVVSMERLRGLAESANKVGRLGGCSVEILGEYRVSLLFELNGCFEALCESANESKYDKRASPDNI